MSNPQAANGVISRLRAYAELLRVSNVLTAVADVWMGMIVATGALQPDASTVLLTLASVLLYSGGMVLNDALDADRDAVERPTRPIPSGRVRAATASALAWTLLALGVSVAFAGGVAAGTRLSGGVALALAGCIVAYDHLLKTTPAGPFAMGGCRALNGLLGMSIGLATMGVVDGAKIACGVLLYIAGVTFFARDEAQTGDPAKLRFAGGLTMVGLLILAAGPWMTDTLPLVVATNAWLLMWGVVSLLIGRKFAAAMLQPSPRRVQRAVGSALQAIILIDAALAWGYAGPYWGLAIFALLPPTMLMARFIPQT